MAHGFDASRIDRASRWSCMAELLLRLSAPLTTMLLARLLTPDAFGLAATATVMLSLIEIMQDAGFRTYLIQHEFRSQEELERASAVALGASLALSILLGAAFLLGSGTLARLAGAVELTDALKILALSLPFTACSSVMTARFRRAFQFHILFRVRVAEALSPWLLAVPLALLWPSFWALIAGMLGRMLVRFAALAFCGWRQTMRGLRPAVDLPLLRTMISFSLWTSAEFFIIWLCGAVPIAIVGRVLDAHSLGLYSITVTTAAQIMATASAAFLPVAFSVFSRCQNDTEALRAALSLFQRRMAFFLLPMGVGCLLFSDVIVRVLLGAYWHEAAIFLGIYGLASAFVHSICHISSEMIRALGRPRLSALLHGAYAVLHGGIVFLAASHSFSCLVWSSVLSCSLFCALHIFCMRRLLGVTFGHILGHLRFPLLGASLMLGLGFFLRQSESTPMETVMDMALCALAYLLFFVLFQEPRKELAALLRMFSERGGTPNVPC